MRDEGVEIKRVEKSRHIESFTTRIFIGSGGITNTYKAHNWRRLNQRRWTLYKGEDNV